MEGTNPGFLYQQNTMRDAMIAGTSLNIFNNHARRVKMANLAQTVNVLQAVVLTEDEKMLLTPTYHVMKMYNVHQDAKLLPVEYDSPTYGFEGEELPAISISASQSDTGQVNVSLVNIDAHKSHTVELNLADFGLKDFSGTILSSDDLQDHNTFDEPEKITPKVLKKVKFRKGMLEVEVPPFSVLVVTGK